MHYFIKSISVSFALLLLALLSQSAMAQGNHSKHNQTLVDLTKKVIGQITTDHHSTFHLKYRQTTTTRDRMDLPVTTEVEVKIKDEVKHITSPQVDLFMDEKNAFVVHKSSQQIFDLRSTLKTQGQLNTNGQATDVAALLETIWTKSTIKEVQSPKKTARLLELQPTEIMQKASQVARIWLLFNRETLRLERVQLQMIESSFTKTVDFEYLLINRTPSFKKLIHPRRQIFDGAGNLQKRYKNYQLQKV